MDFEKVVLRASKNDVKTTLVDKFGSATYLHDTET